MPGCGWCAPPGGRGQRGRCLEGGPAGPAGGLSCGRGAEWKFLRCPQEGGGTCGAGASSLCPGRCDSNGRCRRCADNTQGPRCSRCRPLFVGPLRGAPPRCRPCRSFCMGRSDVCVGRAELLRAQREPHSFPLSPTAVQRWLRFGPTESDAVCVGCTEGSVGRRCQSCRDGFFLLHGNCVRCQCNGHAATCGADGSGCQCQNNTESAACGTERRDCYQHQCSKCPHSFQPPPIL
ncbi:multiple epidermal growth factor-like domains protein 8 [Lagopus leucura]|uniref:multiple epidermal growth factor-like domains protein 8 n=1 Tax=Lagopus leucura TaxID=30410 RepID=UPI001C6651DB|nr:multiple epidermal growth factor-like domains protein 8 [Lagopus leucura]